ncbi:Patched domain-containing protein 3 [Dirofilaria immitis]|nr:Patched domain-containing protein 3 [Dirofilaria immitis]
MKRTETGLKIRSLGSRFFTSQLTFPPSPPLPSHFFPINFAEAISSGETTAVRFVSPPKRKMGGNISSTSFRPIKFTYFLNCFLEWTAHIVADYPRRVISVIALFTVLASLKLLFVKPRDNLQSGYTPPNARAFSELGVFRKFNDGKDPVVVIIIVMAKDGGSVAQVPHLNEILNVADYVGTHFPVKNYTYYRMCRNFCDINEPIRQFRNGLLLNTAKHLDSNVSRNIDSRNDSNESGNDNDDLIKLSFPIMQVFGRDLDLSPYFFGVEKYESDSIDRISGTNIKYVKLVALHFRTQRPSEWDSDDTFHWERLVGNYFKNEYNNSLIRPIAFSLAYTQDEIVRAGLALIPYILVGFVIMCIFAIGTVSISSAYTKQFSKIKIAYSFIGCITPLMATSTALGTLILLGLRPGSILCVTPFLILAIGVDDAFLMINAWNRTEIEMRSGISSYKTIRERMAVVLTDIGPSITITSLTNMLAFGIGIFSTSTPEIRILCIANAAAIFLDYIYTITLYAAAICIGVTTLLNNYCKCLSSGFSTTLTFILLMIYLTASIKYALMAKGCLTPGKLFLADSPMIEVNELHSKIIMPSYTFVTVFISEPGDLQNSSRRDRMKELVSQFEAIPGCKGSSIFEVKNIDEIDESESDDYTSNDLFKFLQWPEYESLGGFMKFDNQTDRLTAFYVTIAYHGKNQSDWTQRLIMLKAWREIVDRYKDIGASVYEEEALFTDQIDSLVATTLQTSFVILVCMAVVCYIFMPDLLTVLIAISSTASICIGVFGFLTFWNVDFDPVSMATMIMSIGLSVDFPAHITFHYHRTGLNPNLKSVQERLAHSFSVFTKAVVIVISLGTLHALIVVPAVICALSNIYRYFLSWRDYKPSFAGITRTKIADSSIVVQQLGSAFHPTTKPSVQ